jgi:hypothetical protein
VREEVPIAFQMDEAQAVGRLAESEQLRRGRRLHRLVVVKVGLREDVSRVEREAVACPLSYPRHRGKNRRGCMRQALVRPGRIEADPRRLGFQLSDGRVEFLREDAASEEVDLLDGQVTVGVPLVFRAVLMIASTTERGQREPN